MSNFINKIYTFLCGANGKRVVDTTPYVFRITSNKEKSSTDASTVTVFGAETSLYISGFNNPSGEFSFNFLYGHGISTYEHLLGESIRSTFRFGRIVMQSENQNQSKLLTIYDYDPTGRSVGYPPLVANPMTESNKENGTVDFDVDITIFGGTTLEYQHIPGNVVTFYFYPLTYSLPLYPLIERLKKCCRIFMGKDLYKN